MADNMNESLSIPTMTLEAFIKPNEHYKLMVTIKDQNIIYYEKMSLRHIETCMPKL